MAKWKPQPLLFSLLLLCLCTLQADAGRLAKKAPKYPLTAKKLQAYTKAKVTHYRFSKSALKRFRKSYDQVRVPSFLHSFLQLAPSKDVSTLKTVPEAFQWSRKGDVLLQPNPSYQTIKQLRTPKKLKKSKHGFALVGWHIHPTLLADSPFADARVRKGGKVLRRALEKSATRKLKGKPPSFASLSKSGTRYLASIQDLSREHLPMLKETRRWIRKHLKKRYGVDPKKDRVNLYYHFPYAERTATLHLHVRVNHGLHPLERSKSFDLDQIIKTLESGKTINSMSMARQKKQRGGIYANPGAEAFVRKTKAVQVAEVANPFAQHPGF